MGTLNKTVCSLQSKKQNLLFFPVKELKLYREGTLRRTLSTPGLYLVFLKRNKTYCSLRPKNQSLRGALQLAPLNPQPPLCFSALKT